jgi:hypothetical protein
MVDVMIVTLSWQFLAVLVQVSCLGTYRLRALTLIVRLRRAFWSTLVTALQYLSAQRTRTHIEAESLTIAIFITFERK